MKKFLKIFGITVAAIFLILLLAPLLFKGKILKIVKTEINTTLNAKVEFSDFKLSFIRGFPNVYVALENMTVVGIDSFKTDTLASFKSFSADVDIMSVLGNSGINIKSVSLDNPTIHAIVLKDSLVNWNIVKPTPTKVDTAKSKPTEFKIKVQKFEIKNASLVYDDYLRGMHATVHKLNFKLKGDLASDKTTIDMHTDLDFVSFVMGGIKMVKNAVIKADIAVDADMKKSVYTLKDNSFAVNDLVLQWAGKVAMPDTTETDVDLTFSTKQTDFKSALSLVPAVYMKDFEKVKTAGNFKLEGYAKGRMKGKETPSAGIKLVVDNAMFKYPSLPKSADNIKIDLNVFWNGVVNDSTKVDLNKFHVELGGNPFDATLHVRTPMSDPAVQASVNGKIDLNSLRDVIPLDSMSIKGIIAANLEMAGRVSMIEKKQYDKFKANGKVELSNFEFTSKDFPQGVKISKADLAFSPQYVELSNFDSKVGKSDFQLKGKVENFIPYVFSNGIVSGTLALTSSYIDVNEFMSKTSGTTAKADTAQLSVFEVPARMHFVFTSSLKHVLYDKLDITNLTGAIELADQKVKMNNLKMNLLQGSLGLNGEYNTKDIRKPVADLKLNITDFDIPSAFNAFSSLAKFAPAAKNATGKFSMSLAYNSLLDTHMSPVLNTVNGGGSFASKNVQLKDNAMFTSIGEALKSDKIKNPAFKDVKFNFTIKDGRVYLKPFDVNIVGHKVNISGDQGLDQTLNYKMVLSLPKSELGSAFNQLSGNLTALAASKGVKINTAANIDVTAHITGNSKSPKVSLSLGKGDNMTESAKDMVQQSAQQLIEDKKQEAKAMASQKAQELLAKAQTQVNTLKANAQKAADAVKAEADKNAQKIESSASSQNVFLQAAAKKSAEKVRSEGNKKAQAIIDEANKQSANIMQQAQAEADKLK
jgi:hypothetical protein